MTTSPTRILVATDFSEGSDEALTAALDLANRTGADLEILYVLQIEVAQYPLSLGFDGDASALIAQAERELARRADLATKAGVPCSTNIVEGSAAVQIVAEARRTGANVIVVGTHGRRGLAHVLLGSVAERVVQHAACPVLTVPFSRKAA